MSSQAGGNPGALNDCNSMTTGRDMDSICPYCGGGCEAEWVDIGIEMIQAGPYRCSLCGASQIGAFAPNATYSEMERQTGWYEPVGGETFLLHISGGRGGNCSQKGPRHHGGKRRTGLLAMLRPQWLADHISRHGSIL